MPTAVIVGGTRDDVQALESARNEPSGLTWIDSGAGERDQPHSAVGELPNTERVIVDLGSIAGQGAAIDLLRQRIPLETCHLFVDAGQDAERPGEPCQQLARVLSGPFALLSAMVSLMQRDGSGRIVVYLPPGQGPAQGCSTPLETAVSAFFAAWIDSGERERLARLGVLVECVSRPEAAE